MSSSNLKCILNLGNSIIGVGVLAMPYCFAQCGIVLAIVLLLACNLLTRITCYLLMKSSQITRRNSFESLAFDTFGAMGKLMVEMSIIGFLIGCLIAYFVVMGDLGPDVISHLTGVEKTSNIRTMVLVFLGIFVILPFSLLRQLESLTTLSVLSIIFYIIFIIKILFQSLPNIWSGEWTRSVEVWNTGGMLTCLPIFAMSLSCQTQFFEIYKIVPDQSSKRMTSIVTGAVNLCTTVYILVGVLGYISFYTMEIKGNLLTMMPSTLVTEGIKLGFVLSVAISFPLAIFPCRASIHSLLFGKGTGAMFDTMSNMIPDNHFRLITICIVFGTWLIGILVPNIELVLGLNGSTVGTIICIILPTIMFIKVTSKNTNERLLAQFIFGIGVFVLVASTYATLQNADKSAAKSSLETAAISLPPIADKYSGLDTAKKKSLELRSAEKEPGLPIINNISKVKPELAANNSKKEPAIPESPVEKKVNAIPAESKNLAKEDTLKADENKLRKEEALIKKLDEQRIQQEKLIKQQKEILNDIKNHHDKLELGEKLGANKIPENKLESNAQQESKYQSSNFDTQNKPRDINSNVNVLDRKAKRSDSFVDRNPPQPIKPVEKREHAPVDSIVADQFAPKNAPRRPANDTLSERKLVEQQDGIIEDAGAKAKTVDLHAPKVDDDLNTPYQNKPQPAKILETDNNALKREVEDKPLHNNAVGDEALRKNRPVAKSVFSDSRADSLQMDVQKRGLGVDNSKADVKNEMRKLHNENVGKK